MGTVCTKLKPNLSPSPSPTKTNDVHIFLSELDKKFDLHFISTPLQWNLDQNNPYVFVHRHVASIIEMNNQSEFFIPWWSSKLTSATDVGRVHPLHRLNVNFPIDVNDLIQTNENKGDNYSDPVKIGLPTQRSSVKETLKYPDIHFNLQFFAHGPSSDKTIPSEVILRFGVYMTYTRYTLTLNPVSKEMDMDMENGGSSIHQNCHKYSNDDRYVESIDSGCVFQVEHKWSLLEDVSNYIKPRMFSFTIHTASPLSLQRSQHKIDQFYDNLKLVESVLDMFSHTTIFRPIQMSSSSICDCPDDISSAHNIRSWCDIKCIIDQFMEKSMNYSSKYVPKIIGYQLRPVGDKLHHDCGGKC